MKQVTVKATAPKTGSEAEVQVNLPETIEEAVSVWGSELCYALMKSAFTIRAQSRIREMLSNGEPLENIQAEMANFVPKAGPKSKDIAGLLRRLSREERSQLLQMLSNGG